MSAESLIDFEDIYTAVCKKVKIQLTDGETVSRIKQDINLIYLNEVMPFKPRAWWWAQIDDQVLTDRKYITGTVSATVGSASCTFSSAPSTSMDGMLIKFSAYPEVYRIATHTAAATAFTLEETFIADTAEAAEVFTGLGYKIWQDRYLLTEDMSEVIQVRHDKRSKALDAYNQVQFNDFVTNNPQLEGMPQIYTVGDYNEDDQRYIYVYPSCYERPVRLKVKGVQHVDKLDGDADEPIMPVEDRIVLYYGALSHAWERERNETESAKAWNLFQRKLVSMAGKSGDAPQTTEMRVDQHYMINKRYKRWIGPNRGRRWESD